jgi:hypothetical protein
MPRMFCRKIATDSTDNMIELNNLAAEENRYSVLRKKEISVICAIRGFVLRKEKSVLSVSSVATFTLICGLKIKKPTHPYGSVGC